MSMPTSSASTLTRWSALPTTSPGRRRRGRSSLSAFMPNIAACTSLKAVISEVTVILTNVSPTIRTEIHGDLLSILAACPAFHFQEVTIATVPVVTTQSPQNSRLHVTHENSAFGCLRSLGSSRAQIFGAFGPSPPGAPLAAGAEACPRSEALALLPGVLHSSPGLCPTTS